MKVSSFSKIEIWPPIKAILPIDKIIKNNKFSRKEKALITYCYDLAYEIYKKIPPRDNGEESFIHPMNVVRYLDLVKGDCSTLCAGFLHDIIEEQVDLEAKEKNIKDFSSIDHLEIKYETEIENKLKNFCSHNHIEPGSIDMIMQLIKILTRHKIHLYYRSISEIFRCDNPEIKARAIMIKLADRYHNIQTLEQYDNKDRIYQCFKNLFILNNTKTFLNNIRTLLNNTKTLLDNTKTLLNNTKTLVNKTKALLRNYKNTGFPFYPSIVRLFTKNSKATFEALFKISTELMKNKVVEKEAVYLNLALGKYIFVERGLLNVTTTRFKKSKVSHPSKLYDGIIKKYDCKLHHQEKEFSDALKEELDYFKIALNIPSSVNDNDIMKCIDYKDSIALMEVILRLIYKEHYYIEGFECSCLCSHGKICNVA